jgi:YYY domain-containing protein
MSRSLAPTLLALILIVGGILRLTGINWDSGRHLHPDERFLTSVANDITWPERFDAFFDPKASPISPYSLPTVGLYVYGTLPLWLTKWVAIQIDMNNYDSIVIVGRVLSALFDLGSILLLYFFGKRLYGRWVALLGCAFLSLSVLNIQHSHFFITDTFANLFVVLVMILAMRVAEQGRWFDYAAMGVALGAGMASKFSVATLAVPTLLATAWDVARVMRTGNEPAARVIERTVLRFLSFVFLVGLTFRVLQPISFQGPDFWNVGLYQPWVDDINEQQRILSGDFDAPPWHQWTNRPALIFPLQNMLLWGMGLPLGLAAWAGWGLAVYELIRKQRWIHLLPVAYVGVTFLYHGTLWVKFMRYFLPIYPFLALFAGYFVFRLFQWLLAWFQSRNQSPLRATLLAAAPGGIILLGTLGWAVAFTSIYTQTHPRVEASRWMIANLAEGSVVGNEHWDDWLPLPIDGADLFASQKIRGVEMPMYDDDTPEKLDRVIANLSQADYLILSSNRLYDSIPRLPMRYPMTTRYYELLMSEQLGFTRVAEFSSYPSLFGIEFPDQSAEESFSVYDHPRVQVFQKQTNFDPQVARDLLNTGIDWGSVVRLTPKQATRAADLILLAPQDIDRYQSSMKQLGPAPWAGIAQQYALFFWGITLVLIWIASLPLALIAFPALRDRGIGIARTLGLLAISWFAWMLASLKLLPFTWWSVLLSLIAVGAVAWAIGYRRRGELIEFLQFNQATLMRQELLFWGAFMVMLAIRWFNPDLWHPGLGGEKPMDTAYLNAIAATPFFPAYDPWYAGGYINYYYYGFVMVASLIHLSGVEVTTAYNLAVATLFALTASGASSAAASLAIPAIRMVGQGLTKALSNSQGWLTAGLVGAVFVVAIGNLAQTKLLWDGLQDLSNLPKEIPAENVMAEKLGGNNIIDNVQLRLEEALIPLSRASDGLAQVLFEGRTLNFRQEWWYWNATRAIPAGEGEAGPINEFPFFTFLFADLHAHMMALPLTLLALGLCIQITKQQRQHANETVPPISWANIRSILATEGPTLSLAALTIGALWPTNTWDFPTYAMLFGAALLLRAIADQAGRIDANTLIAAGWRWGAVLVVGFLLFKPFHDNSSSAYFGAEAWEGSRTPLWAYLLMHGLFLFILVSWLISELIVRSQGNGSVARVLGLLIRQRNRSARARALMARLTRPTMLHDLSMQILPGAIGLVVLIILIGHPVEALALSIAGLAAILLFRTQPDPSRQLLYVMIAGAALLTAVVEVVVLKGDISRMNTVFKFYLQVWVLWAIAAAAALPSLTNHILPAQPAEQPKATTNPWSARWWQVCGWLVGCGLLYTLTATPGRIADRFDGVNVRTLDGMAYMQDASYSDQNQPFALAADLAAITWMRSNIPGRPTIVEANTPLYRWGARISIYTGMPTVIGWDWHQKQQRAVLPGEFIDKRINDVRSIYTDTNPVAVHDILKRYGVEYIYLGPLERIYYPGEGLNKFEQLNGQLWEKVYETAEVQIYRVR